ncbi:hypothetical protein E2562_004727 [Oryza meyeriana var. granulata]|uniref:Uncharacterized protein n=1 Tax=Oryza meyeriana var. granulata TaxID=110450 RepID=A0A6G1DE97_9ORYZ|nr:hypothetical protein E2562_004727 [Oryza meyeriana var. granulata]
MVMAMFISAIFTHLVRYQLRAARKPRTVAPGVRWRLRILMFIVVAMSLVSVVLAGFIYHHLIEVKVSIFACISMATSIAVYASYVLFGACSALVYYDLFITVFFSH